MTIELQPFNPTPPSDNESVVQFNGLRRDAIGLYQPIKPLTPEQEWRSFRTYHKDAQAYTASYEDTQIAVAVRLKFIRQGRVADLLSFAVAKELRSRSLGSQALFQAEELCRVRQMKVVRVTALDSAKGFYDRNGYETMGEFHHLTLMKKELIH